MEKNFLVYKHLKKGTDEVFYIGKGNIKRSKSKKRNRFWKSIVAKYDYDIKIVEDDLTEQEAFELEIKLIKEYGRRDKGEGTLCNLTDGGEGTRGSIPWNKGEKGLQKAWNKGQKGLQKAWNKGVTHSDDTKKKISKSLIGEKRNAKQVINIETGEIFESLIDVAEIIDIKYATLYARVKNINNIYTPYKFLKDYNEHS